MVAVGLVAVLMGGVVFAALIGLACGAMLYELWLMLFPEERGLAIQFAGGGFVLLLLYASLPIFALGVLALALGLGWFGHKKGRGLRPVIYALAIMLSGIALINLRTDAGVAGTFWLIGVVIISDVAGYFAGRSLGGPKFWPSISPKKTWSGTLAGWLGAAALGVVLWLSGAAGASIILLSVLVCFAGQMGDIGQSALKRHVGVKDSSALIPGHGGVMDRFDALTAAALCVALLAALGLSGWAA